MNGPATFLAVRWMAYDTARQAWASGLVAALLVVTALCVALCLSVTVEGDVPLIADGPDRPELLPRSDAVESARVVAATVADAAHQSRGVWPVPVAWRSKTYQQVALALQSNVPLASGRLTLAFGAVPVELARDRTYAVRTIQCLLAGMVADAAGILLALAWTASFLPTFLEPRSASVLLAKPVPRAAVLAGKYVGVVLVIGAMALLFVATTWLALAVRTGVWDGRYFGAVPVLMVHFAVFYAASALIAVTTRSAALSLTGAVAFWLLCWVINAARHTAAVGGAANPLLEAAYWALPKPLDFHILLTQALRADDFVSRAVDVPRLIAAGAWRPEAAVLTSAAAALVALGFAARSLNRAEG